MLNGLKKELGQQEKKKNVPAVKAVGSEVPFIAAEFK